MEVDYTYTLLGISDQITSVNSTLTCIFTLNQFILIGIGILIGMAVVRLFRR